MAAPRIQEEAHRLVETRSAPSTGDDLMPALDIRQAIEAETGRQPG